MFPNVPAGMTASEYLKLKSDKGKKERYPEGVSNEDEARYNHELDVITSMGYADYHLIVQDYIKRENLSEKTRIIMSDREEEVRQEAWYVTALENNQY